jgi:hypothetical protein
MWPFRRNAHIASGRLVVHSALEPILWYAALLGLPILAVATMSPDSLRWPLYVLGALIALLPGALAIHFALCNPDRLQVEKYQLRQAHLQMIQGAEGPQVVDSTALVSNRLAKPARRFGEFRSER